MDDEKSHFSLNYEPQFSGQYQKLNEPLHFSSTISSINFTTIQLPEATQKQVSGTDQSLVGFSEQKSGGFSLHSKETWRFSFKNPLPRITFPLLNYHGFYFYDLYRLFTTNGDTPAPQPDSLLLV